MTLTLIGQEEMGNNGREVGEIQEMVGEKEITLMGQGILRQRDPPFQAISIFRLLYTGK